MTHGRYHPGDDGGRGELPRHQTEEPLPFVLDYYKHEPPEEFSAFKAEAVAIWRDDLTPAERRMALALRDVMRSTPTSLPAYETDQLPQAARREYELRYHDTLSPEAKALAETVVTVLETERTLMEQQQARSSKIKRIAARAGAAVAMIAGASAVVVFGGNITQESAERQANLTLMAKEAQNLRNLGICAQDMRMELAFDRRNYATDEELRTDATALQTAIDANLPCTVLPPTEQLLHYSADYSGNPESATVQREEITSFVNANWPIQKADLEYRIRHLGEEEYPDEYKLKISVGDKLYVPQSQ